MLRTAASNGGVIGHWEVAFDQYLLIVLPTALEKSTNIHSGPVANTNFGRGPDLIFGVYKMYERVWMTGSQTNSRR